MHHIYTTKAFVIHSTPYGEAGKFLLLFTKDFGMIGAVAQGIRLNKSKLRYHIQDFSFSNISIVRGKEVWRITGAHEISDNNFLTKYSYREGDKNKLKKEDKSKLNILNIKIFKLLKRLLHGEEKNEKLFEIVEALYKSELFKNFNEKDYDLVECLIVLRILNCLGYISSDSFKIFLENNKINNQIIEEMRKNKANIISVINSALNESHL